MYILSSFTADYIKKPLHYLLESFSAESININYASTNIVIFLNQLQTNEEKNQSVVVLFRLLDLVDLNNKKINKIQLEENLKEFIDQIKQFNNENTKPFIIVLCPSPTYLYDQGLKALENDFLNEMHANKIHTLSQEDIQQHYPLTDFENLVEYHTHIPYKPEFYVAISCLLVRKLHCITLQPYKVIIVDCDNTLWTGVAGDIGPEKVEFKEHNLALQKFLIEQKKNGVFICLCSKNEEETVSEVFSLRSEEMPLKTSDVILKKINRDMKSANIIAILHELKLSNAKNAMFIDDSANEIEEVSRNLAEIFCVLMPQSLEEFKKTWAFDENSYRILTPTDLDRVQLFAEKHSEQSLSQRKDPIDFLKKRREDKPLVINRVDGDQGAEIDRIVEIIGKTNQFNLFPFTEDPEKNFDISSLIEKGEIDCFIATITTKQELEKKEKARREGEERQTNAKEYSIKGDLTALAVCKSYSDYLLVTGFFLSCRNTGLEVEYALLKHIAEYATDKQLHKTKIKFKKTEKNKLAETFIDIVCDWVNTNPAIRFLLRNSKKFPVAQSLIKYFLKKIDKLPIDFEKKLHEEIIFEYYTNKLITLDPYLMLGKTLKANAERNYSPKERLISETDKVNAKPYLIELQRKTQSVQPLLEEFFIGSKLKTISNLEDRLITQLNFLLANKTQSFPSTTALVYLGLDSLKATQLSYSLFENEGVTIDISKLLCLKTTISSLLEYIKEAQSKKAAITVTPEIQAECSLENLPVSFQQLRLWYAEQKEGVSNSSNYHMLACYSLEKLDVTRFKQACQQLIKRYDVFGTNFHVDKDGLLVKSIIPPEKRMLAFEVKDLDSETELFPSIQDRIKRPRSMLEYPLIQFIIFKDNSNPCYFIFLQVHHAIFDAVSLKICLDTLSRFYENSKELIPAVPRYLDFIKKQQEKFHDELNWKKEYWVKRLANLDEIVEIPYDRTLEEAKDPVKRKAQRYTFDVKGFSALKNLAKVQGVTCYNIVSSLFSILLSAYSYKEKLAIITATSGREARFVNSVGFFVNLLVQPFDLSAGNKSFIDYLIENNKNFLNDLRCQDIPFFEIQKILQDRISDVLRNPALIYQSYEVPELRLDNKVAKLTLPEKPILFDLREYCRFGSFTLFVQENGESLVCIIEYAEEFYSKAFIKSFAENFEFIIQNVVSNPQQTLQDIQFLADEKKDKLVKLGTGPQLHFDKNSSLIACFEKNVQRYPHYAALQYDNDSFTYAELNDRAVRLAASLFQSGIRKGDKVGIFSERNHLFFIAELAILKIAAVFVPLSKENPDSRLNYIIDNADIKFIVGDEDITRKLCFASAINFINIEDAITPRNLDVATLSQQKTNGEDAVCILYTSGSEGNPKGVILSNKGIYPVIEKPSFLQFSPGERIAQTANHVFDAAQLECWLAWNNAGCLVIFAKGIILDTDLFEEKLKSEKITHMWLTAGLFNRHATIRPTLYEGLRSLVVGGDVVDKKAVENVLENCEQPPRIINGYGPTETNIFALTSVLDKNSLRRFTTCPIGLPINNKLVWVLTRFGQMAPIGGIGQLAIGGDGLGTYCRLPELNAKSFIDEKYLTGDLVKWSLPDPQHYSQMLFLGRIKEEQIKMQGNLVSLPEVRNALSSFPNLEQVEILVKSVAGNKYLLAFYKFNNRATEPTSQDLRDYLSKKLPAYMIPAFYIKIENFPITPNGKLDRKKLLNLPLSVSSSSELNQATTENQQKMLQAFRKVLPFIVDSDSNFLNLGGNSIQAVQLIAEIKEIFNKTISFDDLRKHPTVKSMVQFLEKNELTKDLSLSLLKKGDDNLPAIVFIHPAGGGLLCFNKLFERLSCTNSIYGIEDPVMKRGKVSYISMLDLATHYLALIQQEITGPFILTGYSFGGMVSLAIAAQLKKQGNSKALLKVVLLDTWVVSCIESDEAKSVLKQEVLEYCTKQRELACPNSCGTGSDLMELMEQQCLHYQDIGFQFKPEKLHTPIHLFKAMELTKSFEGLAGEDNYLTSFIDKSFFKKEKISGNHFTLLESIELAQAFSSLIKDLSKNKSVVNVSWDFFSPQPAPSEDNGSYALQKQL